MNFKSRLAKMGKNYKKSEKEYEQIFSSAPPGEYEATLSSCKLDEKGNKLVIAQQYIINEGDEEGRKVLVNTFLEGKTDETSAKMWAFARKFLDTMGYEPPENPEDIEDIIDEMNGSEAVVRLIISKNDQNPDFPNVRVLPAEDSGEEGEEEAGEESGEEAKGEEKGEEEEVGDDDEALRERAVAFAITWDIPDVEEDSDLETVKEAITAQIESDGPWNEGDLEEEEKALLEDDLEIDGAVNKPAPAVKKSIKKDVKKSVKKSAKKSVKKSARRS